ncbi:Uncharacterized protein TCM_012140 [Theobroma cacao]|uniref:Uncharacterized protein n=1 Tax=Theobroma cacao TaxID=3641 RepID=A0A061G190_THECC|nr:Uncharacterized protein TCM_012140 [Theobroma cacao]
MAAKGVDYENVSTGMLNVLHGREHFVFNLSILLQWSPYSTEAELLKPKDRDDFINTLLYKKGHRRLELQISSIETDYTSSTTPSVGNEIKRTTIKIIITAQPKESPSSYTLQSKNLYLHFDEFVSHGTKIIYNLWLNNDGDSELDFDPDPKVQISFCILFVHFGRLLAVRLLRSY